jgi:two-component system, OmpR family, sensor kinase
MSRRWRPSLAFVLGGALAGTLTLSFAGLIALRYLGPEVGFRNAAVLLGATITLGSAVLGWLLVRLLLRPIHALEAYAIAQERGESAARPVHFGTSELHSTAARVILMAETLRDREATVRAFSDHVTHEIRSPVSAIRAASELLLDGGQLTVADATLVRQIEGACAQIERQLTALREVARAREARYVGQSNLAEQLPELTSTWPDLQFRVDGDKLNIPMGAQGLKIVLGQLVRNAVEHGASQVVLGATRSGTGIGLTVEDDGSGVSSGNAERIFDPFFTTRRADGGTGMGLVIVSNLLGAHGGTIRLLPVPKGTAFKICFAGSGPL